MWKVSYLHSKGYRVSRTFDTRELAQEFIDNNALVYPLPGVRLTGPGMIAKCVCCHTSDDVAAMRFYASSLRAMCHTDAAECLRRTSA